MICNPIARTGFSAGEKDLVEIEAAIGRRLLMHDDRSSGCPFAGDSREMGSVAEDPRGMTPQPRRLAAIYWRFSEMEHGAKSARQAEILAGDDHYSLAADQCTNSIAVKNILCSQIRLSVGNTIFRLSAQV
jgi:hypothetical protein